MKNLNFRKILVGVAISFLLSLVLLAGLTALVYFGDFDDSMVSVFVLCVSVISVFVGAFVLAKNIQAGGLVNGLALGLVYCIALFLLSLTIDGGVDLGVATFTRIAVILASAMLGGVLGINSQD